MILFKNNASSRLSQQALDAATTIHLEAGTGGKFPTVANGNYFFVTLVSADLNYEIVKCINVLGDSLVVARCQQGTTARTFPVGSLVELRWTAEQAQQVVNYVPPQATETVFGTVRKATAAEITAGSGVGVLTASNVPSVTAQISAVVPGTIIAFAGATQPAGYLVANGASVSTATYADLFAKIGYTYGGSGTTFKIPDLRGLFIRGVGGDAAAQGTKQTDAIRNIYGYFTGSDVQHKGGGVFTANAAGWAAHWSDGGDHGIGDRIFDASRAVPTAIENRPVNMSMLYCIKY
jgi:hypothetical protein